MLFDYLNLSGPIEEQAREFLDKTREKGIHWAQDSILIFLDFHKERVRRKELAARYPEKLLQSCQTLLRNE